MFRGASFRAAIFAPALPCAIGCQQGSSSADAGDAATSLPPPQAVYKFKGKNGVVVYTDDPSSAPPDAKLETTTGRDLQVSPSVKTAAVKDAGAGEALEGTEARWRDRFDNLRARLRHLEEELAEDEKVLGPPEGRRAMDELMGSDPTWQHAKARLARNEVEKGRLNQALRELEQVADNAGVPAAWR